MWIVGDGYGVDIRGDGIRVCGIPAVMGIGNNYSISKQTQCCKIHKKKTKKYSSINVSINNQKITVYNSSLI